MNPSNEQVENAVARCKVHSDLETGLMAQIDGVLAKLPPEEHHWFMQEFIFSLQEQLTEGLYGTRQPLRDVIR